MDDIVFFRIAERLTLTAVVLIIAIVVMVGFWRSVQKLDVEYTGGIGGSFVFTTPVFVLLAIIGYAWVSLEHPINVSPAPLSHEGGEQIASSTSSSGFIGSAPVAPSNGGFGSDHDLHKAREKVQSLNCLAQGQQMSARVEDDLAAAKLLLLTPVWPADWGDLGAFSDWAMGRKNEAPNAEAMEAFEKVHVAC